MLARPEELFARIVELESVVLTLLKGQQQLFDACEQLEGDRDKLISTIKMLVPKYYTGLFVFDSEIEAEMAWTMLHHALHGPDADIPKFPTGPAYTCPYDHIGECPGHGHRPSNAVPIPTRTMRLEEYQDEI